MLLLVNFLYKGIASASAEEILMVSKYGKEFQIRGMVNSRPTPNPWRLELLQVKEQLKKLQSDASDSELSSAEEDELQIVYEKNIVTTTKPATATTTQKQISEKCSSGRKRTISSSSGVQVPIIQNKKKASVQEPLVADAGKSLDMTIEL